MRDCFRALRASSGGGGGGAVPPGHPLCPALNGKVKTSQLDITNESQEVSPFPAGDHNAAINRRAQKHNKNKTEIT